MKLSDLKQKIGSGGIADVYLYAGKAVKLFRPGLWEGEAFYEASQQCYAYTAGLPVPRVYDVLTVEDRKAIVMDYVKGEVVGMLTRRDETCVPHYIDVAAGLHIDIHSRDAVGMPGQKERLANKIASNARLSERQKARLLEDLESRAFEGALCHGDFHVLNLVETGNGVVVIDWVDACRGSRAADVCRSYLLYMQGYKELARPYIRRYCELAGMGEGDVLSWLPVVAGARLAEHNKPEDIDMLLEWVERR